MPFFIPIAAALATVAAATAAYNYYSDDSEDENYDFSNQQKEEYLEKINYLPFFVATMYSFSNVDGVHKKEEKVIAEFIKEIENLIKNFNDNDLNKALNDKKEILLELQKKYKTIKFSETLEYIPYSKENNLPFKVRETLEKISNDVVHADSKTTEKEKRIIERLDLFLDKGKEALEEIKILEKNENLVKNFYLIQNKDNKSDLELFENTKVVSKKDLELFHNIEVLPINQFYIIHPMNENHLWSPLDINNIEQNITDEWLTISGMLGAKSIEIIDQQNHLKDSEASNSNSFNSKVTNELHKSKTSVDVKRSEKNINTNSHSSRHKKTFKTGKQENPEKVKNEIVWLKNNNQLIGLIKGRYSENPPLTFEVEISGEEFLSQNHHIEFDATIEIANAILDAQGSIKHKHNNNSNTFRSFRKILKIEF